MKVLVTGAGGLLGRASLRYLLEAGADVVATDVIGTGALPDGAEYARLDVTNFRSAMDVFAHFRPDRILHLSGLVSSRAYAAPYETLSVNVMGLANVLEVSRLLDLGRVVYASSIAHYGSSQLYDAPVNENSPYLPAHLYGATKVMNEGTGQQYRRLYGMDVVGLRPHITFGRNPQDGGAGIFNELIRACSTGDVDIWRRVFKLGVKIRPLYVEDAARAFVHATLGDTLPNPYYNIGGTESLTETEMVRRLGQVTGNVDMQAVPAGPQFNLDLPEIDCSLFLSESGFRHKYEFNSALEECVHYHRKMAQDGTARPST